MITINTWNPSDKGSNIILSNNNLTATTSTSTTSNGVRGNYSIPVGKWYWEVYYPTTNYQLVGIATNSVTNFNMSILSPRTGMRGYESHRGVKLNESDALGAYTIGDNSANQYIGIAVDTINGTLTFYKNGVSQGVAFTDILSLGTIYPFLGLSPNNSATVNFGATSFQYKLPNGYKALNSTFITKYLIQDKSNVLKTVDGSGNIIDSPSQVLDEANYLTNGIDDVNSIPVDQLKVLGNLSDFKLLMYTDDTSKEEAKLIGTCDPFDLTQWLKDNECSLKMWTDDTAKTEATMEYELLTPYKPIDILKKNNGGIANIVFKEI